MLMASGVRGVVQVWVESDPLGVRRLQHRNVSAGLEEGALLVVLPVHEAD